MKRIYFVILSSLLLMAGGCADDFFAPSASDPADGSTVEAHLSLTVNELSVASGGTRATTVASEAEKRIDDIWVFQYDAMSGNQLVNAAYYKIGNQKELENLKVLLKDGVTSNICVVANTGDPSWGKGDGFKTYSGLKAQTLPNPYPIKLKKDLDESEDDSDDPSRPIPMEGEVKNVTVPASSRIEVHVTRMFAKLIISFGEIVDGMTPNAIEVNFIPEDCSVKSPATESDEKVSVDYGTYVFSSFNADTKDWETRNYVIYVPENLKGVTNNVEGIDKSVNKPNDALNVSLKMNYLDPDTGTLGDLHEYIVYPGGNDYNNFNIKRNNVYNVKINIKSANKDVHTPSSNCFVVKPGRGISFEPYYRTETGGGYNFRDYLDPDDNSKKKQKVIDRVELIWQTKDAIGDNENGDKVWYVPNEKDPEFSKIYVKTNKEGNALIGAYNEAGDVIWSWHIWITDNDPGNVGNAIEYYTYDWDKNGIKNKEPRVRGYKVMPCNLGALANVPATNKTEDITKTFGMLYQWGRKDPFPPMIKIKFEGHDYTEEATGEHYDYTNKNKVLKTRMEDPKGEYLFRSISGNNIYNLRKELNPIEYSVRNPTVFMCGTKEAAIGEYRYNNAGEYYANGDWNYNHDDKLWGGIKPDMTMEHLNINNNSAHIFKNYGDQKSIFDPCPAGWRVPPGDLWLGFSKTGLNPVYLDNVNYDKVKTDATKYGMYMYMQKSRWNVADPGPSLFFPTQGPRSGDGSGMRVGDCGNYHNATTDMNNRVNILHIHNAYDLFRIFETQYYMYYVKSVGGPVRCVRDRKG